MRIRNVEANADWILLITADDGKVGSLDIGPWLDDEAFAPLRDYAEFAKVRTGGYFIEWDCGADLSADTVEARWQPALKAARR